jgi:hypothetical protein
VHCHRNPIVFVACLATGCAASSLEGAGTPSIPTVSLCELAAHSSRWNRRLVRLNAIYISDIRHYSDLLKDKSCPNVSFEWGEGSEADSGNVASFYKAVVGDVFDLSPRDFNVEIIGRVGRAKEEWSQGTIHVRMVVSYHKTTNPFVPASNAPR